MSKYKPLDAPITRREACLILDRKHFDGLVRSGHVKPLGKLGSDGVVPMGRKVARTAPLLFDQAQVRAEAALLAEAARRRAAFYLAAARGIDGQRELTRRQINTLLGTRLTGILIRSGKLVPSGKLTDTQTAAHTFGPGLVMHVATVLADDERTAARELAASAKKRVPA